MPELKPCPFCGGEAEVQERISRYAASLVVHVLFIAMSQRYIIADSPVSIAPASPHHEKNRNQATKKALHIKTKALPSLVPQDYSIFLKYNKCQDKTFFCKNMALWENIYPFPALKTADLF